jgi:N-glycosylase/DNA lyase
MGFRADYLFDTSRIIAAGGLNPAGLCDLPLAAARTRLMCLPGVGRKIADCVLLLSCGLAGAFPVDVWIARVLREFYFPGQQIPMAQLIRFTEVYFGPQAGYAQQYLFHYIRTRQANALRHKDD